MNLESHYVILKYIYETRKCDTRIHLMKLEMNDTRKFPDDTEKRDTRKFFMNLETPKMILETPK